MTRMQPGRKRSGAKNASYAFIVQEIGEMICGRYEKKRVNIRCGDEP